MRSTQAEAPGAGPASHHTIQSYFDAFAPAPTWVDLPAWPPDVFALTNLVLDHTEVFRFAVSPPSGRRWPPMEDWNARVSEAARAWREASGRPAGEPPPLVRDLWAILTRARTVPLGTLREGGRWDVSESLLTLHAIADEACAVLEASGDVSEESFEDLAWAQLAASGSLSRFSPSRVRIVPKVHSAPGGITIRSLSRYLALCYESVEVRWHRIEPVGRPGEQAAEKAAYNVLLLPWPLSVSANDFRVVSGPLANMDARRFGFFQFSPERSIDLMLAEAILEASIRSVARVDAVVLPEAAVESSDLPPLEEMAERHGVQFLLAGVRQPAANGVLGRNYVHVAVRARDGWFRYQQDKHHRWCLDERQIRQYQLTRVLHPGKLWWEGIDLSPRILQVNDLGSGLISAPLVCEDLARMDEVADLVRRIGPTFLIAFLLDGPQLSGRWPSRYAGVLSDDPGSAVLTVTSLGMALRSRPPGVTPSRVVALWTDTSRGSHEIALSPGAEAILLTVGVERRTVWTADGRQHADCPNLVLNRSRQVRSGRKARTRVNAAPTPVESGECWSRSAREGTFDLIADIDDRKVLPSGGLATPFSPSRLEQYQAGGEWHDSAGRGDGASGLQLHRRDRS